jgi:diaminohydroxyphosphoribosylaminopyrimidine deaminase/5-amino-6-(5-phosphoribosylamino)uracil reductase
MNRHEKYMQQALELAERGRGYCSPNPMVGAILVKNDTVVGTGYHRLFGAPHAEIEAVRQAGAESRGAILYVNLEPCSHQGKTPPCTDCIIDAGIAEVYVAMIDPNPIVNRRGIRQLQAAGIKVNLGILEQESRKLNRGFIYYITKKRPWITLKMAETADGYIADVSGKSRWITATEARQYVMEQRRQHDAIMIGMGTVFKDDPGLLPQDTKQYIPYRIILDDTFVIPQRLKLVSDEFKQRTIIVTTQQDKAKKVDQFQRMGIHVLQVPADSFGWIDLPAAMKYLAEFGITSIYAEGGGLVAGSLIQNRLVDELQLFIAPKILGKGISTFSGFMKTLDNAVQLEWEEFTKLGQDILIRGKLG